MAVNSISDTGCPAPFVSLAERPQPRAREPKSFRKRTDLAIEIAERKDGDPVRRRISRAASTNGGRVRAAAPRAWGRRHFLAPKFAYLAPRPGALNAPPQMCDPRGAGSIGHAELRAGLRCLRLRPGLHIAPDDFADLLSLYGGDGADGASRRRAPALGVAAALRRVAYGRRWLRCRCRRRRHAHSLTRWVFAVALKSPMFGNSIQGHHKGLAS